MEEAGAEVQQPHAVQTQTEVDAPSPWCGEVCPEHLMQRSRAQGKG